MSFTPPVQKITEIFVALPDAEIPKFSGNEIIDSPVHVLSPGQALRARFAPLPGQNSGGLILVFSPTPSEVPVSIKYLVLACDLATTMPVNAIPVVESRGLFLIAPEEHTTAFNAKTIIKDALPRRSSPTAFIADRPIFQARHRSLRSDNTLMYISLSKEIMPTAYYLCALPRVCPSPPNSIAVEPEKPNGRWQYYAIPVTTR